MHQNYASVPGAHTLFMNFDDDVPPQIIRTGNDCFFKITLYLPIFILAENIPGFLSTYSLWDKHRTSSVFVLETINMIYLKQYTWGGQLRAFLFSLSERKIHLRGGHFIGGGSSLAGYFSFGLF